MGADPSLKIASIVLPAKGYRLLLPNSAIEEVRALRDLRANSSEGKHLAGYTELNSIKVPVIAFEQLGRPDLTDSGGKPVIVILKPFEDTRIAILASNTPSFVQASVQCIQHNYSPQREHPCAGAYGLLNGHEILIPDLAAINKTIN